MKRVLFLLMITLMAGTVVAQPKNRRQQQAQQQGAQSQNQGMSMRARLMFPQLLICQRMWCGVVTSIVR